MLARLFSATLAFALAAAAQSSVTFAPQGAAVLKNATGQVIRGAQILDVIVCAHSGDTIPNGEIYQTAVLEGFSPIGPAMGTAMVNQHVSRTWTHSLLQLMTEGALDVAIGGIAGVVSIPTGSIKALTIGHAFLDKATPQLLAVGPQPTALLGSLLDPTRTTVFSSPGCIEATMLATYVKGSKAVGPVGVVNGAVQPAAHAELRDIHIQETALDWMAEPDATAHRIAAVLAMRESAAREYETSFRKFVE